MNFDRQMKMRLFLVHEERMQRHPREIFHKELGTGDRGLCAYCRRPIPDYKTKTKRFCTSDCKTKHHAAIRSAARRKS